MTASSPISKRRHLLGGARVAAGEITPQQLITIGQIAEKYRLYTKITGGSASICWERRSINCP